MNPKTDEGNIHFPSTEEVFFLCTEGRMFLPSTKGEKIGHVMGGNIL